MGKLSGTFLIILCAVLILTSGCTSHTEPTAVNPTTATTAVTTSGFLITTPTVTVIINSILPTTIQTPNQISTGSTQTQSCFEFSDVTTNDEFVQFNNAWVYSVQGEIINNCTKNYRNVNILIKFYDQDNLLIGTAIDYIPDFQPGEPIRFYGNYFAGSGKNRATGYELGIEQLHFQSES